MSAARWFIKLEEQSDFDLRVAYENPKDTPVDITDYGARLEVRDSRQDGTVRVAADTSPVAGEGSIFKDDANGIFHVKLTEAIVTPLKAVLAAAFPDQTPNDYLGDWDLLIFPDDTDRSVNPLRLVEGKARYSEAVAED